MDKEDEDGLPLFTSLYINAEWAIVVTPHENAWRVAVVPSSAFRAYNSLTLESGMMLVDLLHRTGKRFNDIDSVITEVRRQLDIGERIMHDAVRRDELARKEKRIWRIYNVLMPGLNRLLKSWVGLDRHHEDERGRDNK